MSIIIPQILFELWRHKLRSSLAIFCIAFGVFSVVMLLALGESFHLANKKSVMGIADDSFYVGFNKSSKSSQGYSRGQTINTTITEIMGLENIFPEISAVSTMLYRNAKLSYAGKVYNEGVRGVGPQFTSLFRIKLTADSRFINQLDVDRGARVVVISDKIKKILFGERQAIGEKILIDNTPFTVIGVVARDKNESGRFEEIFISSQAYEKLYGDIKVHVFFVLVKPGINRVQFEQLLRGYFARKYHFDKDDKEAMDFWGSNKIHKFFQWFFIIVQIFLGFCGLMILAVGSVGVANIMFLIVTERAYEIGLRKALGASDKQILLQLFFEALVIVGVGGGLGLIAAFFTIIFLQYITLPNWIGVPELSWITAVVTVFVMGLVGLVSGFFPARRASKIDPVEALC